MRTGMVAAALLAVAAVVGVCVFQRASDAGDSWPAVDLGPLARTSVPRSSPEAVADLPPAPITTSPYAGQDDAWYNAVETILGEGRNVELHFVHEDGAPVARGAFAAFRDTEVIAKGSFSSAGGVHHVPAQDGCADLLLATENTFRRLAQVSMAPGIRRVVVPSGARIAGRIEVEGGRPAAGVLLDYQRSSAAPRVDEVPFEVLIAVDALLSQEPSVISTAEDGSFDLRGFTPGWTGSLTVCGDEYGIAEACGVSPSTEPPENSVQVTAPAEHIRLRLKRRPAIIGRLLSPTDGLPVRCRVLVISDGFQAGPPYWSWTNKDGRFRLVLPGPMEGTLTLRASHRDMDLSATRTLSWSGNMETDLGDIVLNAERVIELIVRNECGGPVSGVGAISLGPDQRCNDPADAAGVVRIRPATGPATLRVTAPGHEPTLVEVPAALAGPFPVTLVRWPRLTVTVTTADARNPGSLLVRVRSPSSGPARVRLSGLGLCGNQETRFGVLEPPPALQAWSRWRPVVDQVVVFDDLRPGIPLLVEILDPRSTVLASSSAQLSRGEELALRLHVAQVPREVRGRIIDSDGRLIGQAQVNFGAPPDDRSWVTANGGHFVVRGLFGSQAPLTVRAPGFAPLSVPAWRLPPEDEQAVITLERGRTVVVRLRDEGATPADLGIWWQDKVSVHGLGAQEGIEYPLAVAEPTVGPVPDANPGRNALARIKDAMRARPSRVNVDPFEWVFPDLPEAVVLIVVDTPWGRLLQRHDTRCREAVVLLPVRGRLLATWETPVRLEQTYVLRLESVGEPRIAASVTWTAGEEQYKAATNELLPGSYEVWLEAGTRSQAGETQPVTPLSTRRAVRVWPDATARVDLPRQ